MFLWRAIIDPAVLMFLLYSLTNGDDALITNHTWKKEEKKEREKKKKGGLNKVLGLLMTSPSSHVTDLWALNEQTQPHMPVLLHYKNTYRPCLLKWLHHPKRNQKFNLLAVKGAKAHVWELVHLILNISHNMLNRTRKDKSIVSRVQFFDLKNNKSRHIYCVWLWIFNSSFWVIGHRSRVCRVHDL